MRPSHLPIILCASISLLLAEATVHAQSANKDASGSFVDVYSDVQTAEKLEASGNLRGALRTYKEAARMLDGIAQHSPNWNPTIVEYRRKLIAEAISKLIAKVGPDSGAGPEEPPTVFPPNNPPPETGEHSGENEIGLPLGGIPQASGPERTSPKRGNKPPVNPTDLVGAIKQLQDDNARQAEEIAKVRQDNLALVQQLKDAAKAQKEAESQQQILKDRADAVEKMLAVARQGGNAATAQVKKLQEQYDKAHTELRDMQIERDAAEDVRKQVAGRLEASEKRTLALQKERDDAVKLASGAAEKIAKAQEEAAKATAKLNTVIKERDDALQQVVKMKEAQKQVDKLVTDNAHLMAQLTEAENQISQFKVDGLQKDQVIADLKKEVITVQKQLSDTKKESANYQTHMGDIQEKLNATAANLAAAKADGKTSAADRKKALEENEVLKGIVMREMKEQARRDQTRKLVLGQMGKLGDKSGDLLKQISYLSEPVVKLTPKELALFKTPKVEIGDNEISMGAPKEDTADSATAAASTAPATGASDPAPVVADAKPAGNPAAPDNAGAPEPALPAPAAAAPTASATPEASKPPLADAKPEAPADVKPAPMKDDKSAPPAESKPSLSLDTPAADALGGPGNESAVPPLASMQKAPDRHGKAAPDSGELPKKGDDATAGTDSGGKSGTAGLPPDLVVVMQQAKDEFERANYRDAEKLYEKVLNQAPTNLSALDNLGVVRFRSGKLKLAEEAFRKAIAIAPEDAFSHCTLGIVYYSSQRYDEAVNELTKALAITPKNATAHNYLGITASQKGWPEAAQKELETATALDPTYADAQFNLAVVYVTQQPPNKENARKYYRRAIELGAEPDSSLEQLLK